ncbi:MAG: hypothetical protein HND54_14045 [Bacteroidetes bacterium]|nr:hypothetical protein [Bacteroidota bacterium]NOG58848.1 hypothetical protein [Bacteroidota bacterium]
MKLWKSILTLTRNKKEDIFWRNPDVYLAAIILNNEREQVCGIIKNDLALLERIPKPETGFFYKDVVRVNGPTGTQMFRDDEIDEYEVIELHKASNIPTFTFKAIIPDTRDYFKFLDWFKDYNQKVEFPWSSADNNTEWRKGRCTAENLEQAKKILTKFAKQKKDRQVKDINEWDYYLKLKK